MHRQRGFTLIEMMIVLVVLSIVMGAVFSLLNTAQQRYKAESDVMDAFASARETLDQFVREAHNAGYPPSNHFPQSCVGGLPTGCCATCNDPNGRPWDPAFSNYVAGGWSFNAGPPAGNSTPAPSFPTTDATTPCTPGGTAPAPFVAGPACRLPDNFNIIMEEDVDPENNNGVEWVVYTLRSPTGGAPLPCSAPAAPQTIAAWAASCPQPNVLWRGVLPKLATGTLTGNGNQAFNSAQLGGNVANAGLVPIVYNVVNDPTSNNGGAAAQVNQQLFRYGFTPGNPTASAANIRTVYINLIVRSAAVDPALQTYRIVNLQGAARRFNY